MLNIAVVGGIWNEIERQNVSQFCQVLGQEIATRGHTLLGGAQTELDKVVASAAFEHLTGSRSKQRIQSWVPKGKEPCHAVGRVMMSVRESWDPGDSIRGIPEPIERADVVVLIGGFQGTRRAYWWASAAHKPVLPIAYFGGAAEEIYERELEAFDRKYGRRMRKEDYEQLNEVGVDYTSKAKTVVRLVEDIAHSQQVCVAMSYSQERETKIQLDNVFDVFCQACTAFDYKCGRVTEMNTEGKITHEIMSSISNAGFVIVDLTELRQNVMYELGFADGLEKPVVTTARRGTEIPFDIKDKPVLFWDAGNMMQFRDSLKEKIRPIAERQGKRQT
jgi:predicted Rossmann-fold nucleotide-binding protein